ncbi:HPF/RaiA family ribosome-associated protein [Candidatus Berkelbacteria bacterium]|nr:HPF/RaiA family ribosome-associated protein [Candidatus Berkelbacteria bacterium]
MNIIIKTRHAEVEESLKAYASKKMRKLRKFLREPAMVELTFEDVRGGLKGGRDKSVHITATVPKEGKPIHVEELSDDFAVSVDLAELHLRRILERYHEKSRRGFRHVWRRIFRK